MSFIFLSYSRQDSERVRDLYDRLRSNGYQVWFDEENLLPGQIWEAEIKKAIRGAALVIVALSSRSVTRTGYAQKEIRTALDFMDQIPAGQPYLIPLKLDDCEVPDQLGHIHCGSLVDETDFQRLLKALDQYSSSAEDGTAPESALDAPLNYSKYVAEFKKHESLIIPGYGISPLTIGVDESAVRAAFGAPTRTSEYGGDGNEPAQRYLEYLTVGLDFRLVRGSVTTIFAYASGKDGHSAFTGSTPERISLHSRRQDVERVFGRPPKDGGNGVINYWVSYPSLGLAITYDTIDTTSLKAEIHHLSVTLPY